MIDHFFLPVGDLQKSKHFYERALAPVGYKAIMEYQGGTGYGTRGKPYLFLMPGGPLAPRVHLAFVSPDRRTVDAFHAAALAAGGRDYGAPGLRPHYHANYYGAFVLDPDGNNVEVVCHSASDTEKGAGR
jgi:catechol 2,3-dioxygenase-like lactoylglutathione lyase family enzyme